MHSRREQDWDAAHLEEDIWQQGSDATRTMRNSRSAAEDKKTSRRQNEQVLRSPFGQANMEESWIWSGQGTRDYNSKDECLTMGGGTEASPENFLHENLVKELQGPGDDTNTQFTGLNQGYENLTAWPGAATANLLDANLYVFGQQQQQQQQQHQQQQLEQFNTLSPALSPAFSPALSLEMPWSAKSQDQNMLSDGFLTSELGLSPDPSGLSASVLSSSPGFGDDNPVTSPDGLDYGVAELGDPLAGISGSRPRSRVPPPPPPMLVTDLADGGSLSGGASLPTDGVTSPSPFTAFSWNFQDFGGRDRGSTEEMEISNDAWDMDFASVGSLSPNAGGWSSLPGSYSYVGNDFGLSKSPAYEVDTSSVPWGFPVSMNSAVGSSTPMEGVDNFDMMLHLGTGSTDATTKDTPSQQNSQLLTVPKASQSHRRMSDPPPMKRSLHKTAPTPNQRARAKSTLAASLGAAGEAYPSIKPQPVTRQGASEVKIASGSGLGAVVARQTSRGKRNGPMPDAKKREAHKTRMDKSMCINCRISKVKCTMVEGTDSCTKCRKATNANKHSYVCTRAYFTDLVLVDTTNYIAQFSINHPVPGSSLRRRRLEMPQTIEIPKLIHMVERLAAANLNIRVSHDLHGGRGLYELDLRGCGIYLRTLAPTLPDSFPLRELVARHLCRPDEWRRCIVDADEVLRDPLAALTDWGAAPSRVAYTLVAAGAEAMGVFAAHTLDPDAAADRSVIFGAAQIARIVGRRLEITAYTQLQTDLSNGAAAAPSSSGEASAAAAGITAEALVQLGRLVLSLRWRLAWWSVLGTGIFDLDCREIALQQRDLEAARARVGTLCRTLYFYYCSFRRRRLSSMPQSPESVDGEQQPPLPLPLSLPRGRVFKYVDALKEVYEMYPEDETVEGYEQWMREGRDKIREARVAERLQAIGLVKSR